MNGTVYLIAELAATFNHPFYHTHKADGVKGEGRVYRSKQHVQKYAYNLHSSCFLLVYAYVLDLPRVYIPALPSTIPLQFSH